MDISDTVLDFKRDFEVQLSTNIGEDQLLFRRSQDGKAIEKTPYEIASKASQAAIGVACSMGTRVHPVSYIKVGVDGMGVDLVGEVLEEVVLTLRRTEEFSHCQVMSVLFAQNLAFWAERRKLDAVRRVLVELRNSTRLLRTIRKNSIYRITRSARCAIARGSTCSPIVRRSRLPPWCSEACCRQVLTIVWCA